MNLPTCVRDWLVKHGYADESADNEAFDKAYWQARADGDLTEQKMAKLKLGEDPDERKPSGGKGRNPSSREVFGGGPNVKAPSKQYSTEKAVAKHAKTGKSVIGFDGCEVMTTSGAEMAKMGAFIKWQSIKQGKVKGEMLEHEKQLVEEMLSVDEWCGDIGGEYHKSIPGARVKALISDSPSGGIDVNPLWFDENLITFPLLHSELLPFVDIVEMPRSATVQGGSIQNPTVTWGPTPEGTAMNLFNTSSLVGPLNASVFNVTCAVEIGRDFIADADVQNIGGYVVQNVGQAMLKEYDRVIANGDGVTQPQGIANASGINTVHSAMFGSDYPVISDVENLIFSLPLQYRRPPFAPSFISSDATYARSRAIPIGSDDARRIFGMDEGSYTLMTYPCRIQQDITLGKLIFGALKRYRLWRRLGQQVEFTDQGQTLRLKNTTLLTVRARMAGKVVDPTAFQIMPDFGPAV